MEVYDLVYLFNFIVCIVIINVIRNLSFFIFIGNYEIIINENYFVGDVILIVIVRDVDFVCISVSSVFFDK